MAFAQAGPPEHVLRTRRAGRRHRARGGRHRPVVGRAARRSGASGERLKHSPVPAPLVVVLLGVGAEPAVPPPRRAVGRRSRPTSCRCRSGTAWAGSSRPSNCPTSRSGRTRPCTPPPLTIAAVASLETLLNLEAVDKIDPQRRTSPPSRELIAQGVGNVASGLDRRPAGHLGDRPQFGEHQRRCQDQTLDRRPRRPAAGQRGVAAGLAEPDPAVLPGGHPAGHRGEARQPGPRAADVEPGALPVRPVRRDGGWPSS